MGDKREMSLRDLKVERPFDSVELHVDFQPQVEHKYFKRDQTDLKVEETWSLAVDKVHFAQHQSLPDPSKSKTDRRTRN